MKLRSEIGETYSTHGDMKNTHKTIVEKSGGNRPLSTSRLRGQYKNGS
jgi:hypothetical protein